jgi:vacuolar-type H+-ATPase subunit I/STV1
MSTQPQILPIKKMLAVNWLILFTSSATLICCAIPALLVSLGLGAVMVGLVSNVPQLIWISEHKPLVFGIAGALLMLAVLMQWRSSKLPCPADRGLAQACMRARKMSKVIYSISLLLFAVGSWFAFVAPYWIE